MPPTSSPLSGCPLKRLEIHDRLADKFLEAAHLDAALTLSLEGQRLPSEDRGDLVLQAHCGLQRVLSFALTDLLNSPNGKADSVSIEKDSWQLCVHSQQHDQRILASFAGARDFNVAACMLRKFGFQVKTGIPQPTPRPKLPPLSHHSAPSVASPGPRLSSITPLPWPGSQEDQQSSGPDPSFASMLNSSVPVAQGAVYGQYQPVASPAQVQVQSRPIPGPPLSPQHFVPQMPMPPPVYHSPFNPYHVFLGRQVHSHQPIVGSPLRNAFQAEGTPEPMGMVGLDPLLHRNPSRLGMLQDGRSISVPIMPYFFQGSQESQTSQYSLDPHYLYPQGLNMSPLHLSPPSGAEGGSQSSAGSLCLSQPQAKQDIKDLMPPPRELPFALKVKKPAPIKTVTPKPKPKPKPKSETEVKAEPKAKAKGESKPRAKSEPKPKPKAEPQIKNKPKPEVKQTGGDKPGVIKKAETEDEKEPPPRPSEAKPKEIKEESGNGMQLRSGTRKRDAPSTQDPNPDRRKKCTKHTPIQPQHANKVSSTSISGSSQSARTSTISSQSTCPDATPLPPTMLLTGRDVLEKINRATAKLLGQYEADLARGCGAESYARFYAERIHLVRRDFWVAELRKAEGRNYC